MASIDVSEITQFLKAVVELDGSYFVDSHNIIMHTAETDDNMTPVLVETSKRRLPLKLFSSHMRQSNEEIILNPFSETLGRSVEKEWLLSYLQIIPGKMLKSLLIEIAKQIVNPESATDDSVTNFKKQDLLSLGHDLVDDKTVGELEQIRSPLYASILYIRKNRMAQLKVLDFDRKDFKFRKNTWKFIDLYIQELLPIDFEHKDDEIAKYFTHKSDVIGAHAFDSTLHVVFNVLKSMQDAIGSILQLELNLNDIQVGLDRMAAYQKLCGWYASNLSKLPSPSTEEVSAPWSKETSSGIPIPTQIAQQPCAPVVEQRNLSPNGIPLPSASVTAPTLYAQQMAMQYQQPAYAQTAIAPRRTVKV